ncbi:hypothetical protein [uncultured Mediterranean phage uvMED]|nr:hypothetical protein [uncultured Mediterranean phage uvMED]BAQ87105.1 hypothetical protein [uncultured Mediterranean phage uvMED]BAR16644.1 hypothetical protein [uncultured Mediterranean phage uvMED]BAR16687.1 hypothetical protein [uncultured Mediterranean phage uvMED]
MKDKELELSIYMVDSAMQSIICDWQKFNPEGAKRIHAHWENLKLYLRDNVTDNDNGGEV